MNKDEYFETLKRKENYLGELYRFMDFDSEQEYKVGDIVDLGIHWATDPGAESNYDLREYYYIFHVSECSGYLLDYDNLTDDDKEHLNTNEDCCSEHEVVVQPNKKFRIISINGGYWEEFSQYIYDIEVEMIQ